MSVSGQGEGIHSDDDTADEAAPRCQQKESSLKKNQPAHKCAEQLSYRPNFSCFTIHHIQIDI